MTVLYIQTLSWALGFGIPTSRPTSAGARLHVHVPPEGSIFSGVVQLCGIILKEKTQVSMPS